ncbi:hypothetical protein L7F22_028121 [Adiantum nelumboides]|nr:hypothetical protein [Adiantum nelumboides]
MAVAFLSHVVADLTLGKPALFWLPTSASVRDALRTLKLLADDVSEISIWECTCSSSSGNGCDDIVDVKGHQPHSTPPPPQRHCRCVGKVCMQKILCYLASQQSLCNPAEAVQAPVTVLLSDEYPDITVQHVDPEASLLEALQLIAAGVQNLIVPITRRSGKYVQQMKGCHFQKLVNMKGLLTLSQGSHCGQTYCWLSHEDVLRFLLGSIGVFSPLPMMSIEDLGMIKTDIFMIKVDEEAASALELIKVACVEMSAVAVVEDVEDRSDAYNLVGDISCTTLQACNETVALALATLSAGAFLTYAQECRHPTEALLDLILTRLREKLGGNKSNQCVNAPLSKLGEVSAVLQDIESWEESSSSDGEESGLDSPTGPHEFSRQCLSTRLRASSRLGFSFKSRSGPIFCNPKSSLVAVLLQALAHREHYVWVTREDGTLLGIVTFLDILTAMLNHVNI